MTARDSFPIVGIGASAGGIEALEGLLRGLPRDPGLALVIVTHLSPDRESVLHEVVARFTDLPVHAAIDGMAIGKNHIYVMPADAILTTENRTLVLRKASRHRERRPIDIFLSALAVDIGELAGGIILSGGDADGTLGVKAIKERGEITLAQVSDGFGPQHPDMPEAAISSGLVDFAIPADEMGAKLAEFAHGNVLLDQMIASAKGKPNDRPIADPLAEIYGLLRNQIGHDFSGYKTKTFIRRVQRRMQVTQVKTIEAYVERLRQEPREVVALFRDLLISVTNFFRDEDAFEKLGTAVIPKLFAGRGADDTVRIWVSNTSSRSVAASLRIALSVFGPNGFQRVFKGTVS